jgi:parvulin-like peptidyl-prolyl isomerase
VLGCPDGSREDGLLVTVAQREIRASDVLALARTRSEPGLFPATGAGFELVRDRWIRELIVDAVMLEEADRRGISVPDAMVTRALDPVRAGQDHREWQQLLERRDVHPTELRAGLARRLRIEAVENAVRAELAEAVQVSPEQVGAAMDRLAPPPTLRLRARQLHFDHGEGAREALAQVQGGTPFADLAQRLHGNDGDTGWIDPNAAPTAMLDALATLAVGEVSAVVASPVGWHIFQLIAREEQAVSTEAARRTVEGQLVAEAAARRLEAWISTRLDTNPPVVQESSVAALRCCRAGTPYWDPDAVEAP